jgi:hypothetical protein
LTFHRSDERLALSFSKNNLRWMRRTCGRPRLGGRFWRWQVEDRASGRVREALPCSASKYLG